MITFAVLLIIKSPSKHFVDKMISLSTKGIFSNVFECVLTGNRTRDLFGLLICFILFLVDWNTPVTFHWKVYYYTGMARRILFVHGLNPAVTARELAYEFERYVF